MKTLIYSQREALLDGFKFGHARATEACDGRKARYTQSVDSRGYWLLIEDDTGGDNATYEITSDDGLEFTDTGVEV